MKKVILILCLLLFSGCVTTSKYNRDFNERRGLMLLQTEEYSRNKPLKFSKAKMKKYLAKKIKQHQNKLKRQQKRK